MYRLADPWASGCDDLFGALMPIGLLFTPPQLNPADVSPTPSNRLLACHTVVWLWSLVLLLPRHSQQLPSRPQQSGILFGSLQTQHQSVSGRPSCLPGYPALLFIGSSDLVVCAFSGQQSLLSATIDRLSPSLTSLKATYSRLLRAGTFSLDSPNNKPGRLSRWATWIST
jgi:hypothetical protein